MVCKMGCASARTGTHAGIATVPRTVATLAGCPVRVSQYYRTKKARQKALLSLLERITRLTRCTSARTGTHAGTATVPRTVATLAGCPVRVSRKDTTNKKAQGEMPCAFCWSGLRDSPGAFLRAPARTRAPQQSPGLLLPWRVALFESRAKILRTKKHKAKCLVLFVGADYETRPVRFCAHRHARGHRNSPPDCCYPGGLPCSSLAQRYYEQKSTRRNALCFLLERITRLELATSTLARWRSTR